MMRRFGRRVSAFFSPVLCSGALLFWAVVCAAPFDADPAFAANRRALREPAGLRSMPDSVPVSGPHVIPPSSPPKAQEERHSIRERAPRYVVQVEYPSVGVQAVDQATAVWCRQKMETFISGLADIPADETTHFSLSIEYRIFQASAHTTSIVFLLTTDTGGFQPDQAVAAFTYDLRTARLLRLEDVFGVDAGLPSFLSAYSRKELAGRTDGDTDVVLHRGTGPDALNFSSFALTPEGISLFFAAGRGAAEHLGVQRVDIPLAVLKPYNPRHDLWSTPPERR